MDPAPGTFIRYAMVGRRQPMPVVLAEYDAGDDLRLGQCAREHLESGFSDVPAGHFLVEKVKDDLVYLVVAARKVSRACFFCANAKLTRAAGGGRSGRRPRARAFGSTADHVWQPHRH